MLYCAAHGGAQSRANAWIRATRVIQAFAFLIGGAFAQATIANFLFFFALNVFMLLPLRVLQLGGTAAEIGLIQAMYSITGIVCQPVIGQWVDRIGRRFFMLFGAGLVSGTSAVFAMTGSIPVLALLRGLHGIGFSAFFVANYVHVVDLVPVDRRGWALGIFGVSGLLATALAPLAGEFALRSLGFPALFAGAMLCAGMATAVLARMPGIRPPVASGHRTGLLRLGMRELFRTHMAVACFFGLGTGAIFTFLPSFGELLGVRGVGLFYTAYAAGAILVRVAGGELIDTLGRRAVIVPSMAVQAAAASILAVLALVIAPTGRAPVLPFLFLAGFMAGGAHGFLYPALSALLVDVTPERRRASAVGIFSSVFLVGNAMGAVAFGYVAHGLGYRTMWALLSGVLAIGFAVSLRLAPGRAPVRRRGHS
jgi:MFS family permease